MEVEEPKRKYSVCKCPKCFEPRIFSGRVKRIKCLKCGHTFAVHKRIRVADHVTYHQALRIVKLVKARRIVS